MPSGYDNSVNSISVGNKDKERGWATAGVLHRLDYCRSFTVRIYMVICRLTCSLKLGENKNSKVKVQCLSFQMWPFHIEINPSKCLLNDTEPRPQHFLTKFSSTFQPDSDLHIFQPQPSCIQILMSRNKVGNTLWKKVGFQRMTIRYLGLLGVGDPMNLDHDHQSRRCPQSTLEIVTFDIVLLAASKLHITSFTSRSMLCTQINRVMPRTRWVCWSDELLHVGLPWVRYR